MIDAEAAARMLEVERLRARSVLAARDAHEARVLAHEIDRRRALVVTRADPARVRHVAEVWSSRAADRSRYELEREVAGTLWLAAEELRATRRALLVRADALDAASQRDAREADTLAFAPVPDPLFVQWNRRAG